MKRIKLTQGKYALVDDEDFERVNQWKWSLMIRGRNKKIFHVVRQYGKKRERKNEYLHYFILGIKPKKGFVIDHINGDGLCNRKKNLRVCSIADNIRNQKRGRSITGIVGVVWDKLRKRFIARIMVAKKEIHLGRFIYLEDAVKARKKAQRKYFTT